MQPRKRNGMLTPHPAGRQDVDEPSNHDAKWERPGTRGPVLCDSMDRQPPKKANPQRESGLVGTRGSGEGKGGATAHGDQLSF